MYLVKFLSNIITAISDYIEHSNSAIYLFFEHRCFNICLLALFFSFKFSNPVEFRGKFGIMSKTITHIIAFRPRRQLCKWSIVTFDADNWIANRQMCILGQIKPQFSYITR